MGWWLISSVIQNIIDHANPSSASSDDASSDSDAEAYRRQNKVDRTQQLTDYVITTMRQLARISTGLSVLVPKEKIGQAQPLSLGEDSQENVGRMWNTLHKLNATADTIVEKVQGGDTTLKALDLTLLPPDPAMALETINVKLMAVGKKMDQEMTEEGLQRISKPILDEAWQRGEEAAMEQARQNLACWKHTAGKLKVQLTASMASTEMPEPTVALLQNVIDFLSTLRMCQLGPSEPSTSQTMYKKRIMDLLSARVYTGIGAAEHCTFPYAKYEYQSKLRARN